MYLVLDSQGNWRRREFVNGTECQRAPCHRRRQKGRATPNPPPGGGGLTSTLVPIGLQQRWYHLPPPPRQQRLLSLCFISPSHPTSPTHWGGDPTHIQIKFNTAQNAGQAAPANEGLATSTQALASSQREPTRVAAAACATVQCTLLQCMCGSPLLLLRVSSLPHILRRYLCHLGFRFRV